MESEGREAGQNDLAGSESITLRQLTRALVGQIAWMRLYLDWRHEESQDLMSWPEIQDAVRAFGDRTVRSIYPGYRFVMVYLDSKEEQYGG